MGVGIMVNVKGCDGLGGQFVISAELNQCGIKH